MIKLYLKIIFLFFLPVACNPSGSNEGLLNSRVLVIPAPYGTGDRVRPSRPTIFLSQGSYTCRRRPIDVKTFLGFLENEGLDNEGFSNVFGLTEEDIDNIKSQPTSQSTLARLRPVRVEVGGDETGWLKLGLLIVNGNTGVAQNFFLIVDSIVFVATARYRNRTFEHSGDIQSGYCNEIAETTGGDGGDEGGGGAPADIGSPFLYIIPPGSKVTYNPSSVNPFHNLTLYLEGFPIIDRTGERSLDQRNRLRNPSGEGAGEGSDNESSEEDGEDIFYPGDPLRIIPQYTVDLTLRGHFITPEGDLVAAFTKRVRFFTQSSTNF